MAAAAAAWPADVLAVENRLTASMAELKGQVQALEVAATDAALVDQLCADVDQLLAGEPDREAAATQASDVGEALEELRGQVSEARSLAVANKKTAEERHGQLSQMAATSMAIADTVRGEHTELTKRFESSDSQVEELSEHMNAKIDALSVTMKLAGINAGYKAKGGAEASDGAAAGDASGPATGALAEELAALVRAQSEKASKESVSTLAQTVAAQREELQALSKSSSEAQSSLRNEVGRLSQTAARDAEAQEAHNGKMKEQVERVRILRFACAMLPSCANVLLVY